MEGALFHNLMLFLRLLRGLGFDISTGQTTDLLQALDWIKISDPTDFYLTLRTLLVNRREEMALFDRTFAAFWQSEGAGRGRRVLRAPLKTRPVEHLEIIPPPLTALQRAFQEPDAAQPDPDHPPLLEATLTYSSREMLRHKDFSGLDAAELETIQRFLSNFRWELGQRNSRRFQDGGRERINLRNILRHNFKYGGELLEWRYKSTHTLPRSLVVLADISGSMERYTRLLLYFLHSLHTGLDQNMEAFVFSTRLTRITQLLKVKSVDTALRQVTQAVPDWSGGTRIGEILKTFNYAWSRRVLRHSAVVMLISDGWDRGDSALLRKEMSRLQRSCYRLIWLNPLLGSAEYEPLTRGMYTALPFIDDFLPVHNLVSLEELAQRLQHIGKDRPARRQTSV
jgi:uncharacterized protein with von Willebrand factor type A (vWA) domain